MRDRFTFVWSLGYVWVAMVAFGGILVDSIVIYPNVFHDPPASLEGSMDFFLITGPADLFPPLGAATVIAGAVTLVLVWRTSARLWIGGSLLTLVLGEFLFSMLFFWPRNDIMFEEGIAVHSVEFLRETAAQFQAGHWVRLAMSGVTATLVLIGFLRYHRDRVIAATEQKKLVTA
ncbi:DUF1772 domain-containing protein [Prauserella marina]|uniref:DUF1772 domain-containing protein n=1 Tax=Prauserella marina TaxID=530584 RepID=UPI000B8D2991|nr:anthrone oxygenase family protein [Prauserella marina]ASR36061.1 DUF1772 domain-containing protein [Prauserella marina]